MLILGVRIVNQVLLGSFTKASAMSPYKVNFRCLPFDLDLNLHQNNAMFIRFAELSRWRLLAHGKVFQFAKRNGLQFFAVEQSAKYFKQIKLFQKFAVSTTFSVTDNKWMHFNHVFHTHDDDLKGDMKPVTIAVVTCKAVMKDKNGKTIIPEDLINTSDVYKAILTDHPVEESKEK